MRFHPSDARKDVGTKLQLRPERPVRRPKPRLDRSAYAGRRVYHITLTTAQRAPVFLDRGEARYCETALVQTAATFGFALLAYCFMPDHLHALLSGEEATSDLLRFVQRFKQVTSFQFKRETGDHLWQQSFFDRLLKNEHWKAVARYVLDNPSNAGLPPGSPAYELRGGEAFDVASTDGAKASSLHCLSFIEVNNEQPT